MRRVVVSGVTSVLNTNGEPFHLAWREEIASGARFGPLLATCGPLPRGERYDVATVGDRAREIASAGYDCLKVYGDWTVEEYTEALDSLAEAYLESGDRERAVLWYQKAVEVDPTFANARRMLATLVGEP